MRLIRMFLVNRHGATAIEYAVIASLISIAAVVAMSEIGTKLSTSLNNVAAKF